MHICVCINIHILKYNLFSPYNATADHLTPDQVIGMLFPMESLFFLFLTFPSCL